MALSLEEIEKRIINSYELPNNVLNAVPKPIVTVRTSTYQHNLFIKECIEGVLMQKTTFPFEFIIGEDFSTDGTRKIIFEYAKKNPDKIRVITADYNVGRKANGLRCINASRGKYMAICEGDDYWTDPNKLQKQVDALESNENSSLCFHNAMVKYSDNRKKEHKFAIYEKKVFDIEDVIRRDWFIPTQSIVYRKELLENPIWSHYVFGGDFVLQLLLADKGNFICINEVMSVYRKHGDSVSSNRKPGFTKLKIIETLSFFNVHTNFKYNNLIQIRLEQIRKGFLSSYI
ncbi:glycosyltransferase, partial [Bacteroidota bacterium]